VIYFLKRSDNLFCAKESERVACELDAEFPLLLDKLHVAKG
jgi:hypothetical protein